MCKRNIPFGKKQPCNDCPYRKDAPLKLWAKEEFIKLLEIEHDPIGTKYNCHKNDGNYCVGWLMNQRAHDVPSVALRLTLMKKNLSWSFLDQFTSPVEMYKSVVAMCRANFPRIFTKKFVKQIADNSLNKYFKPTNQS